MYPLSSYLCTWSRSCQENGSSGTAAGPRLGGDLQVEGSGVGSFRGSTLAPARAAQSHKARALSRWRLTMLACGERWRPRPDAGAVPDAVPGALPDAVPGALPGAVPGAVPGVEPEPGAAERLSALPPCGSRRSGGCCGTVSPVRWGGGSSGIRGKMRSWLDISSSVSPCCCSDRFASITRTRPFMSTPLHVNTHAQSAQGHTCACATDA